MKTQSKPGRPGDEVWSAPESGTVRDPSSGNQPSQGQESNNSGPQPGKKAGHNGNHPKDSPAAKDQL